MLVLLHQHELVLPIVRESELLEDLRGILGGVLHGRHSRSLLTAVILLDAIV